MDWRRRRFGGRPLWQRLNGVALLLLLLPKFVLGMGPWRFCFEGLGAACLMAAIWLMFADRRVRLSAVNLYKEV